MSTLRQRGQEPVSADKVDNVQSQSTRPSRIERQKRKPQEDTWSQTIFNMIPLFILLPILYYVLQRQTSQQTYGSRQKGVQELDWVHAEGRRVGHWDFGDGRSNSVGKVWVEGCENCHWVNTNLGNGG